MKLAGSHDLPFPRQAVWDALMDQGVLSRTLPGCEALERTGDDTFAGRLRINVGPVRGEFRGTLRLADPEPPRGYRMQLDGQGPSGFLNGAGTVRLEEIAAGTRLHYDLDAKVGGRIAGVGQRVLDSSARSVARQGLEGLERQLAARCGTAAEGATAAGGGGADGDASEPAPSQAALAATVARDVLADLVPPERRLPLVAAVSFLAGLVLGWVLGIVLG